MTADEYAITQAAREALAAFDLAQPQLTLLASRHNYVYRVDTSDARFVLRIQSPAKLSDQAARVQLNWLAALSQTVPAPKPIYTRNGELWAPVTVTATDVRRAVLLRWLPGDWLRSAGAFLRPQALMNVGRMLARMHRQAENYHPPDITACRRYDADTIIGRGSCLGDGTAEWWLRAEDVALLEMVADRIGGALSKLPTTSADFGMIHADLGPDNWIFDRDTPQPIDFDEFGVGYYLFDLLTVLWSHAMHKEFPRYRDWLLDGYLSVRTLPAEVISLMDLIQGATVFQWLNHGCRLVDDEAGQEFLEWVPSTVKHLARLCDVT